MGRSLLFLVSGLTIITGIVNVNNQQRLSDIPKVTTDYYKAQQARNLSKSLIDNAVETMKGNNNWAGSINIEDVVNTKALVARSSDARKKLSLGEMTFTQVKAIEDQLVDQLVGYRDDDDDDDEWDDDNDDNYYNDDKEEYVEDIPIKLSGSLKSYTESSSNKPSNSVSSWDEYKVLLVSSSTYDGVKVTTEVLMQRDSFSKYSYMTQSELSASGSTIWFMDADNVYGPIHTNGQFAMSGTPSFHGLVTSPNDWIAHSTNPTNPNFFGGKNFKAPENLNLQPMKLTR